MKILLALLLISIKSGYSQNRTTGESSNVVAETPKLTRQGSPFLKYGDTFVDPSENFEIENMPAVRSQDSVGSCFACAAATVQQKFICDHSIHPEIKKLRSESKDFCSKLPLHLQISQLDMVGWSAPKSDDSKLKPGRSFTHRHLRLYEDRRNAVGVDALDYANQDLSEFMSESCYPFDRLVEKYGEGEKAELFSSMYSRTKQSFLRTKEKLATQEGLSLCENCLKIDDLSANFNTTFKPEALTYALKRKTYPEFLYELIFYGCERTYFEALPPAFLCENKKGTSREEAFEIIKKQIRDKKPILLGNLCVGIDANDKCNVWHELVISGYRKVCSNQNKSNCKYELKTQNCWGQDWQTQNYNGWTDAEKLLRHALYNHPDLGRGVIAWLQNRGCPQQ